MSRLCVSIQGKNQQKNQQQKEGFCGTQRNKKETKNPINNEFTGLCGTYKSSWNSRLVPKVGLEPTRLAAGDFESPASTYFATWAGVLQLLLRGNK